MPFIDEVNKAIEILLRPLVLEKDIKEILGNDILNLQNETIYLTRNSKIKSSQRNVDVLLLNNIIELDQSCGKLGQILEAKVNFISEISLN